jgi:hypothetical protein
MPLFTRLRNVLQSCVVPAFLLGALLQSQALAKESLGRVEWHVAERTVLSFEPKLALGLYVETSQTALITFFEDELSSLQQRYWLARNAAVLRGKFEGKAFLSDAAMEAELKQLGARSVTFWAPLENLRLAKNEPLPKVIAARDLRGLLICVGFNCSHYSGGVYGAEYAPQIKALRFPTTAEAAEGTVARVSAGTGIARSTDQASNASLEVDIRQDQGNDKVNAIQLNAEFLFYVIQ